MWIRTDGGSLVNCDQVTVINYVKPLSETWAHIGDKRITICEGDATGSICTALLLGETIMEVGKRG
jgi:hypothetical protein